MSLMMARNADSATKTTAPVPYWLGSLVVSRKGGNHRLSTTVETRLQAELAAPRQPNSRSGNLYQAGSIDRRRTETLVGAESQETRVPAGINEFDSEVIPLKPPLSLTHRVR
jgi:hypothetical protein